MKKLLSIIIVIFMVSISYGQRKISGEISSNNAKPNVSIIEASFNGKSNSGLMPTTYASDYYIQDIDDSKASLGIDFKPKAKYDKGDKDFEAAATAVAKQYAGKMVESIFLADGKWQFDALYEKARESLTENQRSGLAATVQGTKTEAENRLMSKVTDNNFIIIISPSEDGPTGALYSIFKVNIGEGNSEFERYNAFLNMYNYPEDRPEAISSGDYSVELLAYGMLKKPTKERKGLFADTMTALDDARSTAIEPMADLAIRKAQSQVAVLRERALVLDGMMIALGTKEGLAVDDVFISYRELEDEEGNISYQKMGFDRVKKVGNNDVDLVADPEAKGERTQLYGDGGRVSRAGYIALGKKEIAVGVSGGVHMGGDAIPYFKVDYRLGQFTNIPNLFLFVEGEFLTAVPLLGQEYDLTNVNVGVQKTINFGRKFNMSVFASYAAQTEIVLPGSTSTAEITLEDLGIAAPIKAGVSFAIKFGSLQIMPHISYNTDDAFYGGESILVGGGLRYNF